MQKWEYLYVAGLSVTPHYLVFNQKTTGYKEEDLWGSVVNELGAQGWEMISGTWDGHWFLIFKRPLT